MTECVPECVCDLTDYYAPGCGLGDINPSLQKARTADLYHRDQNASECEREMKSEEAGGWCIQRESTIETTRKQIQSG